MKSLLFISVLIVSTSAKSPISAFEPPPQHIFSNPPSRDAAWHYPTVRESTAMARKILHLTTIGDLVTVFPDPKSSDVGAEEQRPLDVGGSPIGLLEYYADCDPLSGNPILLGISIATPYRNYQQGSNISLSVAWWPIRKTSYSIWARDDEDIPTPHTPAALPRFSLHGHLEPVSRERLADGKIQRCFLRAHPDSIYWQPGNDVHESQYVQLIVDHVYWFGGFGDRARIQWLPIDGWRNFTMGEIMDAKLPGERKQRGWFGGV